MNPVTIRKSSSLDGCSELRLVMMNTPGGIEYKIIESSLHNNIHSVTTRFVFFNDGGRVNEEYHRILGRESKWSEVEQKLPVAG